MTRSRSLSVIIPNYYGEELLPKFLPSVEAALKNYTGEYEIVIVDDASKDGSWKFLEQWTLQNPIHKIARNKQNIGFSGTCNVGIAESSHEILFFLNNDVRLAEDFFNYFNSYFDCESTFALAVAGFNFFDGKPIDGVKRLKINRGMTRATHNHFPEPATKATWYETFSVQGSYFFADRAKTLELNGFDELMSPYLYEETDLCYRALKRGWKIYYEPKAKAYHAVSSSLNKIDAPFRKKVISQRNRLIFIWKNIHDQKMLLFHHFWLRIKLFKNEKVTILAYREAKALQDEIEKLRKKEINEAKVTDGEIFKRYFSPPTVQIPVSHA